MALLTSLFFWGLIATLGVGIALLASALLVLAALRMIALLVHRADRIGTPRRAQAIEFVSRRRPERQRRERVASQSG